MTLLVPGAAAVEHAAVVPHDEVVPLPEVGVDEAGLGRELQQMKEACEPR